MKNRAVVMTVVDVPEEVRTGLRRLFFIELDGKVAGVSFEFEHASLPLAFE
jgi:hypothetical protein